MSDPTKMHVRVRKDLRAATGNRRYTPGVLIGARTYTPEDGPIELDHRVAERLIKEGTVEAVVHVPVPERAVAPPAPEQRRGAERR
jgi:hypothetical protein